MIAAPDSREDRSFSALGGAFLPTRITTVRRRRKRPRRRTLRGGPGQANLSRHRHPLEWELSRAFTERGPV